MSISNYFLGKELTIEQQALLVELELFLQADNNSTFLLKGYAGTGKTFVTTGLTRYLDAENRDFVIMAPTGKAAKVIASKTKQEAKTIHRVIYNFCDTDKEQKDEYIYQAPQRTMSTIRSNEDAFDTVYIIDESSMISDKFSQLEVTKFGSGCLLQDLLEYIDLDEAPNRKIIFIGDNAQLPPVRNAYSPALIAGYLEDTYQLRCNTFELTEVVRQKLDSGVMKNAINLRNALADKRPFKLQLDTSTNDVHSLAGDTFLDTYLKVCHGQLEGSKDAIIIAYTNKQVSHYNNAIRAKFFSPDAAVQIDERVICVSNDSIGNNFISNGEFGKITKIISDIEHRSVKVNEQTPDGIKSNVVDLRFLDIEIEFMDDYGKPHLQTRKILLNLLYNATPSISALEKKALHIDFNKRYLSTYKKEGIEYKVAKHKDAYFNFLHIKFGYAITCHKAQGSEWPYVFVDTFHWKKTTENYCRWLYTAITRTQKHLHFKQ